MPLFIVVLVVETTDVIFAVDSIPAILAITLDPLIVYTSNVFAILGLRARDFALAGVMQLFHYYLTAYRSSGVRGDQNAAGRYLQSSHRHGLGYGRRCAGDFGDRFDLVSAEAAGHRRETGSASGERSRAPRNHCPAGVG